MEKKNNSNHSGAISIDGYDFLANSVEVARLWVQNDGPATCVISPERLSDPEMFGMLMVDTIRHGARAYAQCHRIPEAEALRRIWQGLDEEREEHTTPLSTLQDYGETN